MAEMQFNTQFDTQMGAAWGWRGVLGFISPAVSLSIGAESAYRFGLLGVAIMEVTLGLIHATDENVSKVLPGLENAAKTLADQGANFICLGGPPVAQCLEAEFGKPVVFDDTQFYWAGLKALNIRLPVKGLGKLFEIL